MTARFFILILFFFRLAMGWRILEDYGQGSVLSIAGNIHKVYRSTTNCDIVLGRFVVKKYHNCIFSAGDKVRVIGTVEGGVIDNIFGRIVLGSSTIDRLDEGGVLHQVEDEKDDYLEDLRRRIYNPILRSLPEPESGLVAGIVFGIKKDIGRDFYDQMVKSGTIHIAVASGYNVTVIGGTVLTLLFWFMKRKWATVVAIAIMVLYALLAGWEAPVVRAVIMASVVFVGMAIGRKSIGWWSLFLAAWVMIMIEPDLIVEASFQLSVVASIGLFVIEPMITKWIESINSSVIHFVSQTGVVTTLAAMIATAPIIWWHFSRVTWIGILSNILIVPFIPPLMLLGMLMALLGGVMTVPVYALAHWVVGVIRFFGS